MNERTFDLAAILLGSGGLGAGIGLLANESYTNDAVALTVIVFSALLAAFLIVFGVTSEAKRRRESIASDANLRRENMEMVSYLYANSFENSGKTIYYGLSGNTPPDPPDLIRQIASELRTQGDKAVEMYKESASSKLFRDGVHVVAKDLESLANLGPEDEPPLIED